jgi:hypothetical protein
VGIPEMQDDIIPIMDWSSLKFRSNGGVQKYTDLNGDVYTKVRGTTGFQYIVDICLFGELEFSKPSNNAIIHSIPAL